MKVYVAMSIGVYKARELADEVIDGEPDWREDGQAERSVIETENQW